MASVELQTGAATLVSEVAGARIARRSSSRSPFAVPVESIAALGVVPDDKQAPRVVVDAPTTATPKSLLTRGIRVAVSCDEACSIVVGASSGRGEAGTGMGEIQATAGSRTITVRMQGDVRDLLRTRDSLSLRLDIGVIDAAGNATTLRRSVVAAPATKTTKTT